MSVTMKTTQYGLSKRAGGWDPYGDSNTDLWRGFGIPGAGFRILNLSSCALTKSAEAALVAGLPPHHPALKVDEFDTYVPGELRAGALLKVTFQDKRLVLYRTFDDRAPEADPRLDIFLPWKPDNTIPDHGTVEVIL